MKRELETHARRIYKPSISQAPALQTLINWHPHRVQTGEHSAGMGIACGSIWILRSLHRHRIVHSYNGLYEYDWLCVDSLLPIETR